ncbi:HIT family protein [Ilumatobacter sp.]|uniref:HIT family protein n=1 Tax=Ilumatobacter sp. TaxID=1967498 RepID=UPI003B5241A9
MAAADHPARHGGGDPTDPAEACVFCRIASTDEPAEIVFADDVAVAFLDVRPLFVGHTLVIPRRHLVTLADLDDVGPFFERVRAISAAMPAALGSQGTFVANNNVVSQSVAHLHVHVVPRTRGDGLRGFFWPRTSYADGEMAATGVVLRDALGDVAGAAD